MVKIVPMNVTAIPQNVIATVVESSVETTCLLANAYRSRRSAMVTTIAGDGSDEPKQTAAHSSHDYSSQSSSTVADEYLIGLLLDRVFASCLVDQQRHRTDERCSSASAIESDPQHDGDRVSLDSNVFLLFERLTTFSLSL